MDVKGPADGGDVSPQRRELLRQQLVEASQLSPLSPRHSGRAKLEVYRLTEQLKKIPEVRGELVAEVTQRLRDEYFSTRESAERAAEAILRTLSKD